MVEKEHLGPLMALTSKTWRQALDQRLRPLGLSQAKWAKWMCLLQLHRHPRLMAQGELAEVMGIEAATLVRLLDRLEADGWILRQMDPEDRRSNHVLMTDRARSLGREVEQVADELRRDLLAGIPSEEVAVTLRVLRQLLDRARMNLQ